MKKQYLLEFEWLSLTAVGMLLFIFAFVLILWMAFRPGSKGEQDIASRIPLDDDQSLKA